MSSHHLFVTQPSEVWYGAFSVSQPVFQGGALRSQLRLAVRTGKKPCFLPANSSERPGTGFQFTRRFSKRPRVPRATRISHTAAQQTDQLSEVLYKDGGASYLPRLHIGKAVAKDAAIRYQTASEMQGDLRTLQGKLDPVRRFRKWMTAPAAAAVLAAIGIAFWVAARPTSSPTVQREIKLRQLTANSSENHVGSGAISPDGQYLAYSDFKGMHVKSVASGATRPLSMSDLPIQEMEFSIIAWFPGPRPFIGSKPETTSRLRSSLRSTSRQLCEGG